MNVDRIARAMTAGGPSKGFKARVMAPIHGRPRPDFTARVMDRIEAAQPFRSRVVVAQRVALAAFAVAIFVGIVMLRGPRVTTPPAPEAPRIASAAPAALPTAPVDHSTPRVKPRVRKPAAAPQRDYAAPAYEPIYTIAALEAMPDIAMKSIEPASCTVPALAGPAPLKVSELKDFKERR